jgi:hypothetical protein
MSLYSSNPSQCSQGWLVEELESLFKSGNIRACEALALIAAVASFENAQIQIEGNVTTA